MKVGLYPHPLSEGMRIPVNSFKYFMSIYHEAVLAKHITIINKADMLLLKHKEGLANSVKDHRVYNDSCRR